MRIEKSSRIAIPFFAVLAVFGGAWWGASHEPVEPRPPLDPIEVAAPVQSSVPTVTAPTADGIDDFGACDGQVPACDAISDKGDKVACLKAATDQTDAACEASLARRDALNIAWREACKGEMGGLCRGVVPVDGKEPMVECLWSFESQLSSSCLTALQAHRAAKPAAGR